MLGRAYQGDTYGDFNDDDCNHIRIIGEKIFSVGTLRVNYTTYDIRRDYDHINPKIHPDIMVEAPEDDIGGARFWYARVIGIFHANIQSTHPDIQDGTARKIDFLWVRWFGTEPDYISGFGVTRLPKIGFIPSDDDFAFSFLDPGQVIRGCHLIPVFAENPNRTSD